MQVTKGTSSNPSIGLQKTHLATYLNLAVNLKGKILEGGEQPQLSGSSRLPKPK